MYHPLVIKRFYVHNFRCLENFELAVTGLSSVLLIGKNGSGKSSVLLALQVLQRIARDINDVDKLLKHHDFSRGRTDVPMRIELDVDLQGCTYSYSVAFKHVAETQRLEVTEESVIVDGKVLFDRNGADSGSARNNGGGPVEQQLQAFQQFGKTSPSDPLFILKEWLQHDLILLQPLPGQILGDSNGDTREPSLDVTNLGGWFSGLLKHEKLLESNIVGYLKQVMPDFIGIKNLDTNKGAHSLVVEFSKPEGTLTLPFGKLSDGEKCFVICALVLAASESAGPLVCFWDEPDNYLALSEVGHFVLALRKNFNSPSQFIATSHNPEAIRRFSNDNTFVLNRRGHLEPTIIRPLREMRVSGDLVNALIRGDVEP